MWEFSSTEAARSVVVGFWQVEAKIEEVLTGANLKVDNIELVEVKEVGNTVRVKVNYRQPSVFPGLPLLVGGGRWSDYFCCLVSRCLKGKEVEYVQ